MIKIPRHRLSSYKQVSSIVKYEVIKLLNDNMANDIDKTSYLLYIIIYDELKRRFKWSR